MNSTTLTRTDERIDDYIAVYRALCRDNDEKILSRRNMTMNAVARFARNLSIADLHSDQQWIVSLTGTVACEHAGVDRTGENILSFCTPEDRALRVKLANMLFTASCGLRATMTDMFEDGSLAKLDTVSLPLLGNDGERKLVSYSLLIEDIDDPHGERPVLRTSKIENHCFVDLGHGVAS